MSEKIIALQKKVDSAQTSAEKAGLLVDLAIENFVHGDYDIAEKLLLEAIDLAEKESDNLTKLRALNTLGNVASSQGKFSFAMEHYKIALDLAEQLQHQERISTIMGNIGNLYRYLSDYSMALEYKSKALAIDEKIGNVAGIARQTGDVGNIYRALGEYERAGECYKAVIEYAEKFDSKYELAASIGNLGIIYAQLGEPELALEYMMKALALDEQHGFKQFETDITSSIGIVYCDMGQFELALEYMMKALNLKEQVGDKLGIGIALSNIGTLYSNTEFIGHNFEMAEEWLLRALAMQTEIGAQDRVIGIFQQLAKLYQQIEKWQSAYEYHVRFFELKQKVQNEEVKKSVDDFKMQMLAKEKEIERLKNVELAQANEELVKLNSEKNEFLGIAAHDLKNPLSAITSSIGILKRYGSRLTADEVLEKHADIERTSQRMLAIITNLLGINAIERGAITFKSELFNLTETVQEVVDSNRQLAEEKKITLNLEIPKEPIEIIADRQITSQIIDNLVSNAVKYSQQNKNVCVNVEANEKLVKISVRDEGPGLSPEDMEKLFGRFQRLSAKPTGGEHSTGLGLSIVKKLVEAMNGKVWCESELGKGAKFIVELPKIS